MTTRTVLSWTGAILYLCALATAVFVWPGSAAGTTVLIAPLLIGVLRRVPMLALALALTGALLVAVVLQSLPAGYAQLAPATVVLCYIVATRTKIATTIAAVAVLVVQTGCLVLYASQTADLDSAAAYTVLSLIVALFVGYAIRQRRTYTEEVRAKRAEQALTAERLRIARELHDMVAHSIGIIAIQAGVGARVIDTQPSEARNALTTIEVTSRQTLAGLRQALGTLRNDGTHGNDGSEKTLEDLAAATEAAGVRVNLTYVGERRPVPEDAYRIVQEALTNVIRHAGTDTCTVLVEYQKENLVLEIVDDGRGCDELDAGYGILGMRERVGLLDGEFSAGPRPEGGFRVTARLPRR